MIVPLQPQQPNTNPPAPSHPKPPTNPPRLVTIALSGFGASACLAASLGVTGLRDVFVTSLCNFTSLHSPGSMKQKNGLAFKALLRVAVTVGDGLEDRCGGGARSRAAGAAATAGTQWPQRSAKSQAATA
jgi:hypothetical protein